MQVPRVNDSTRQLLVSTYLCNLQDRSSTLSWSNLQIKLPTIGTPDPSDVSRVHRQSRQGYHHYLNLFRIEILPIGVGPVLEPLFIIKMTALENSCRTKPWSYFPRFGFFGSGSVIDAGIVRLWARSETLLSSPVRHPIKSNNSVFTFKTIYCCRGGHNGETLCLFQIVQARLQLLLFLFLRKVNSHLNTESFLMLLFRQDTRRRRSHVICLPWRRRILRSTTFR